MALADLGAAIEQVYAFEPDRQSFQSLVANARDFHRATSAQVSLWPCAVAERTGTARFHSDGFESARLDDNGQTTVTTLALDDALATVMPTDIKMDIEGAELDALKGAEASIRKHRPKLAISLYHNPEDIETIPRYLAGLDLGYRFYLEHHTIYQNETVLFAMADSRTPKQPK